MYKTSVLISCPASPTGVLRNMPIDYTILDGKPFPFPCQGCDDSNGSAVCEKCRADVTLEFWKNPPVLPSIFVDPLR